jgi:hypothetical protein
MTESVETLDLLSLKEISSKVEGLPSWVPDFSSRSKPSTWNDGRGLPWKASGNLPMYAEFLPDNQLEVRGFRIGSIRNSTKFPQLSPLTDTTDLPSFLWDLPEFSKIVLPHGSEMNRLHAADDVLKSTQQTRLEVFWRTMVLDTDCFMNSLAPSAFKDLVLRYVEQTVTTSIFRAVISSFSDPRALWKAVQGHLPEYFSQGATWNEATTHAAKTYTAAQILYGHHPYGADIIHPPELLQPQQELKDENKTEKEMLGVQCLLLNEMLTKMTINNQHDHPNAGRVERLANQLCWSRKIFTTDSGCMGTGIEILDSGDEVWILAGADIPMILRSLGGQRYRLLGESYVHGGMFGPEDDGAAGNSPSPALQQVILV